MWKRAFSMATVLCVAVSAEPVRTTVRPADNGAILENPSMGWVFHHFDNSIHEYGPSLGPTYAGEGWPGLTVAYLRLAWSYLEPEDGAFDWSLVDEVAERYIRAGRKIAFRFTCFESAIPYATPKWLADAGVPGRWYKHGVGIVDGPEVERATWEPHYDNPLFLEKLGRFLAAAARRYDGNPDVAFVDIGSIGIWGEGNPCSRKYPLSMYKTHIDLHVKHFENTLLVGQDDWYPQQRQRWSVQWDAQSDLLENFHPAWEPGNSAATLMAFHPRKNQIHPKIQEESYPKARCLSPDGGRPSFHLDAEIVRY